MKRIATIGAIITAFAVAPAVAAAGNNPAQSNPQISAQVVGVQTAKVQRAQAAISVQRHLAQVAQAKRFSLALPRTDSLALLAFHPRGRGAARPLSSCGYLD